MGSSLWLRTRVPGALRRATTQCRTGTQVAKWVPHLRCDTSRRAACGTRRQNAACVAVPATTYQVTKRPQIKAPGRLDPVRRQVKVAMTAHIARSGTNWMAMIVESGTKPGSGLD